MTNLFNIVCDDYNKLREDVYEAEQKGNNPAKGIDKNSIKELLDTCLRIQSSMYSICKITGTESYIANVLKLEELGLENFALVMKEVKRVELRIRALLVEREYHDPTHRCEFAQLQLAIDMYFEKLIPEDAKTASDLHDYVDANMYGFTDREWEGDRDTNHNQDAHACMASDQLDRILRIQFMDKVNILIHS